MVAGQNHRQTRRTAAFGESLHSRLQLIQDLVPNAISVQNQRHSFQ